MRVTDRRDIADDHQASSQSSPRPLGGGLDLADVVGRVLETFVPSFANSTAVFVLEQSLSGDQPASHAEGNVVARRLGTGFAQAGQPQPDAALPAGEVIAFRAGSAPVECMRLREPVTFTAPDDTTLNPLRPGARIVLARYTSFLAVPLVTGGPPIGFLVLGRAPGKPGFDGMDKQAVARPAARAAASISACLTVLRHRSAAAAPKPDLTATVTPQVDIAGRCLPAAGYDTGGDWYDIIPLPEGRTGLVVGDALGHGAQAATLMAQLSVAAHALAALDLPPAEVLRQLHRTTRSLPDGTLATCSYAVIDPATRSCAIAIAGHLPPVLALPDGTTRVPELPGGPSLGIGTASYGQARIKLGHGTILTLYTDGLVETRTRPYDQGILALRSVLADGHEDLEATCDALVESLGEHREDDITVVLIRIPG